MSALEEPKIVSVISETPVLQLSLLTLHWDDNGKTIQKYMRRPTENAPLVLFMSEKGYKTVQDPKSARRSTEELLGNINVIQLTKTLNILANSLR